MAPPDKKSFKAGPGRGKKTSSKSGWGKAKGPGKGRPFSDERPGASAKRRRFDEGDERPSGPRSEFKSRGKKASSKGRPFKDRGRGPGGAESATREGRPAAKRSGFKERGRGSGGADFATREGRPAAKRSGFKQKGRGPSSPEGRPDDSQREFRPRGPRRPEGEGQRPYSREGRPTSERRGPKDRGPLSREGGSSNKGYAKRDKPGPGRPDRSPRGERGPSRQGGGYSERRAPRPQEHDLTQKLVATCALGLELTVGRELEALGLGPVSRDNAQVSFPYSPENVAKANYWLRTADRVWLQLAEFWARDFEELFQGVKSIDWAEFMPQDARFPVEVISTKSRLESESSCQSVSKKAVVDKMQARYGRASFPETGADFSIRVFIVYDRARVFIDTSGEGLHRRGYRTYNAKAPLRETVAAALVLLSHWSPDRELYDPMCGSGTILLEAACIGLKKAAGVERSFASQRWGFLGRECWESVHAEALELYDRRGQLRIYGSDNDGQVLKLARTHLEQSGLDGRGVQLQKRDVAEFSSKKKYGVMITNPPYGRRLSSGEEVEELTRLLSSVFEPLSETWSLYYYTGFDRFVEIYGREPERVRKIYNGRIEANLLQYPGPRPPNLGLQDSAGGTQPIRKRIPLNP